MEKIYNVCSILTTPQIRLIFQSKRAKLQFYPSKHILMGQILFPNFVGMVRTP